MASALILFELAWRFMLVSALAFGGATAALPEMHRFLVEQRHWLDDAAFTTLFAISQASPGPNVLFVALFGWRVMGLAGALTTMLAMCGPSSLCAVLVERYVNRHRDAGWIAVARRALAPLTVGLVAATGTLLTFGADHGAAAATLTAATVAVGLKTRLNPLWLIAAGAALGAMGWV